MKVCFTTLMMSGLYQLLAQRAPLYVGKAALSHLSIVWWLRMELLWELTNQIDVATFQTCQVEFNSWHLELATPALNQLCALWQTLPTCASQVAVFYQLSLIIEKLDVLELLCFSLSFGSYTCVFQFVVHGSFFWV